MEKEIITFENIEFYKIPNVEYYFVSKCGKVYSNKIGGKMLKPRLNNMGYEYVGIYITNKQRNILIHRLIAITFLNLPVDNDLYATTKLTVNHINEIKNDNRVENLEVVTVRENTLHSSKSELGIKGVYIDKRKIINPFRTQIQINNIDIYLGYYSTAEIAIKIYQLALQNIHLYNGNNKEFREQIKSKFNLT